MYKFTLEIMLGGADMDVVTAQMNAVDHALLHRTAGVMGIKLVGEPEPCSKQEIMDIVRAGQWLPDAKTLVQRLDNAPDDMDRDCELPDPTGYVPRASTAFTINDTDLLREEIRTLGDKIMRSLDLHEKYKSVGKSDIDELRKVLRQLADNGSNLPTPMNMGHVITIMRLVGVEPTVEDMIKDWS